MLGQSDFGGGGSGRRSLALRVDGPFADSALSDCSGDRVVVFRSRHGWATGLTQTAGVASRNIAKTVSAVDRAVDWPPGIPSTASAVCGLTDVVSAA